MESVIPTEKDEKIKYYEEACKRLMKESAENYGRFLYYKNQCNKLSREIKELKAKLALRIWRQEGPNFPGADG